MPIGHDGIHKTLLIQGQFSSGEGAGAGSMTGIPSVSHLHGSQYRWQRIPTAEEPLQSVFLPLHAASKPVYPRPDKAIGAGHDDDGISPDLSTVITAHPVEVPESGIPSCDTPDSWRLFLRRMRNYVAYPTCHAHSSSGGASDSWFAPFHRGGSERGSVTVSRTRTHPAVTTKSTFRLPSTSMPAISLQLIG